MPAIDYARVTSNTTQLHESDMLETSRVTEILLHNSRVSLHPVLLPMISQLSRDNRWLTLINPPADLSRKLLTQAGAITSHILSLHSRDNKHDTIRLCQQALSAGTSHTVIAWHESGRSLPLQQLDLAASCGNAQAILVRH